MEWDGKGRWRGKEAEAVYIGMEEAMLSEPDHSLIGTAETCFVCIVFQIFPGNNLLTIGVYTGVHT